MKTRCLDYGSFVREVRDELAAARRTSPRKRNSWQRRLAAMSAEDLADIADERYKDRRRELGE